MKLNKKPADDELLALHCPMSGKKVADFGSGLGVAGLAAALAGAQEVVLLDREPMALSCGLMSAAASGVEGVRGLEHLQQLVTDEVGQVQSPASSSSQALVIAQLLEHQKAVSLQQQPEVGHPTQQEQQQQHNSQPALQQQLQPTDSTPLQQDASMSAQQAYQAALAKCTYRALPFDWNSSHVTERYDVILACDVLYEAEAVSLVASAIPRLLKPGGSSTLLLADPPNRTAANRQKFLDLLSASHPTRLLLQESGVEQCDVQQLDPEMLGGVTSETVAVQFMVFQSAVGNDTIGLKVV